MITRNINCFLEHVNDWRFLITFYTIIQDIVTRVATNIV